MILNRIHHNDFRITPIMTPVRPFLVVLLILAGLSPAFAHALLKKSIPASGAVVAGPAFTFTLQFNSRVDGKRSRMSVVMPDGKTRTLDIGEQPSPDTLIAPVKGLLAGEYKLVWQVLAADGHISRGSYPFQVR
jgi:methionine-rich copper-binding protein CopC